MQPADTCRYCGHDRSRHNRREPANPQPGGDRCARGCVCPVFKERDGRPMYARLESEEFVQHRDTEEGAQLEEDAAESMEEVS